MSLVESLAALFEAAWRARPKQATGLRVSVGGRDQARVGLRYQVARTMAQSGEYCWRQYGIDQATYARIGRGHELCPFAESDEAEIHAVGSAPSRRACRARSSSRK
ncbi:MAG: hypothetical protein R3B99_08445 [Polyangiales bacterium]